MLFMGGGNTGDGLRLGSGYRIIIDLGANLLKAGGISARSARGAREAV